MFHFCPLLSAVLLAALLPAPTGAQQVTGRVVTEGWGEPVGGAVVVIMDGGLAVVDSATTDPWGRFEAALRPGTHAFQARNGHLSGPLGALLRTDSGAILDLLLEVPSPSYRAALSCLAADTLGGTAVVAGVVFEQATATPLPDAVVRFAWTDDAGREDAVEARASATGSYVACGVPAARPLSTSASLLGSAGAAREITLEPLTLVRYDAPIRLGASTSMRITRSDGGTDTTSTLFGRVRDAATGQAVAGARVTLVGSELGAVTDGRGLFRLLGLVQGTRAIEVEHIAYGEQVRTIIVPPAAELDLELSLTSQAIELGEIRVRSRAGIASRYGGASPLRTIVGPAIEDARERGTSLASMLTGFPGLRVRFSADRRGAALPPVACIEAVGRQPTVSRACDMVEFFLDGISITGTHANELLARGLRHFERVEFLRPGEALRWGMHAGAVGAIMLWTRRGPG